MAVRVRGRILYIDFRCMLPDGRKVRCIESTGMMDTEKGRQDARQKDKVIKYLLKTGTFDYLAFFPDGSKARYFRRIRAHMPFSAWWDTWISEKTLAMGTERIWRSAYKNHIGPHFGTKDLASIMEEDILVFRKALEQKGLEESSINKYVKILSMALYKAHKRGLIHKYPCADIIRLREDPVDIEPFSFEELDHFLATLLKKRPTAHDLIFFWARTGLRPGELCALKWDHIDFYNRKAMIRRTMLSSGIETRPKTRHSIRDIDLRPAVMDVLRRQEARTGLMHTYIFMRSNNRPYGIDHLRHQFRFWLRLARLKYRAPKQMRHTFATLHLAAGEQIGWVSRMLGHASPKTTWERYFRFIPNLTRDDGSAFEALVDQMKMAPHHDTADRIGNNLGTMDPKLLK